LHAVDWVFGVFDFEMKLIYNSNLHFNKNKIILSILTIIINFVALERVGAHVKT
jgi:hypothetical protein